MPISRPWRSRLRHAVRLPLVLIAVLALQACGNSSNTTPSASAPGAPGTPTVIVGNASALLTWTAPADGGSPITGYTVTSSPGGVTSTVIGSVTTATVLGLNNGTSYTFTVTATNALGTGLPSAASLAATPATVPDAPTAILATPGNASVLVGWAVPPDNGSAITGYTVTANTGATMRVGGSVALLTFTGLTNGVAYTFTVTATNAIGSGTASSASGPVTPAPVPDPPANVTASAGNASAVVSWTAPSGNGNAITSYTVTPSSGAAVVVASPATSTTISGLTNGSSYTFTVAATNAVGTSPPSAASPSVTPATVPGAPTAVTASPGNATALVGWTAPSSNGGSIITGYTVTSNTGLTQSAAASASSLTFTGLVDGVTYTFTVTASNAVGAGAASPSSPTVTPSATALTITVSPRQAGITVSQTLQYAATVSGNSNTSVNWSVDGTQGGSSSVGTISSSGLYTPPGTGGVHVVSATSQADSTRIASATLGVTDLQGVFTYHNDIARSGLNHQEYALNPTDVAAYFGKLFSCTLDGAVYAQPLYVANLSVNANGYTGTHNVVFVATMNDSVYAIDADDTGCVTYWYQNFLPVGAVAVPVTDASPAGDVPGTFGIMGTPVISGGSSSDVIYMVARYKTATTTYTEELHALYIGTGLPVASPVTISPSVSGTVQGGSTVTFNPLTQAQRPALLLLGANVYVAFGSAGDDGVYNGWLVAYDTTTLAQNYVFNSTPNGGTNGKGAFWLCGSGPASDGTDIFIATANGVFDNTGNVLPPAAPLNDMGDSLLKLNAALVVQDFFTPSDQATDAANDVDFGSGGVIVLPGTMGGGGHSHLVIATGKPGKFYMDDRDTMGRYLKGAGNTDANVQTLPVNSQGIWSTPAVWASNLYVGGFSSPIRAYAVVNGQISSSYTMQTSDTISQGGGTPSISAAGTGTTAASNPIVWILDNGANGASFSNNGGYGAAILKAFDATTLVRLYSSATLPADAAGNAVKFTVPTVANGKVYVADGQTGSSVGTTGQLTVYGLKP